MSKSIIVFDLDGTLVETAPDLFAALNHALDSGGITNVDPVAIRPYLGFGARVMIERAFLSQKRDLHPDQLQRLFDLFLQHYADNIPGSSAPFPGAVATLDRFSKAGWLLAICTNKTERLAKALMSGLKLDQRFSAICGQDTFPFRKPNPRHLIETIRRAGGDVERAIMVGDSYADIEAAKGAGIPVVAVDFGYTDRHVREFEPSRVISHFDELTVDLANRLLSATH